MFWNKLFGDDPSVRVVSPVDGELVPLDGVPDPMFSEKLLGDGVAIRASSDLICSPVDGIVASVFPSMHAVGFLTDAGVELLIHIGINTVELNGRHFRSYVAKGQRVRAGQPITEFDREAIRAEGYDNTVMVLVTNSSECKSVKIEEVGTVKTKDTVMTVLR